MRRFTTIASALAGVFMGHAQAQSEEVSYFAGDVWSVSLSLPAPEDADPCVHPQCMLGSRAWPHKGVNIVYALINADYIEPWLQIYSENWELPLGKRTKVDLVTVAGALTFELVAGSAHFLTGSIDPKIVGKAKSLALETALFYMRDSRRTGLTMRLKFAGNEPEWFIPAMDRLEAHQLNAALGKCIGDLRSKGAAFHGSDHQGTRTQTSPFAE